MSPTLARSQALAVGWGVLLATLGGACSSSDADVERVSQARFAEEFAHAWCRSVAPCCAAEQLVYDAATCESGARAFAATMLANRVRGDTTYSPAAATDCLTRLERTLQRCEIEEASTACALIFVGPSPNGTPCTDGSACASGYCAVGEAVFSGVCAEAKYQSPIHGQAGEPCVGSCGVPGSFECPASLLPNSEGTITYCYADDGLYCGFDSDALDALGCQPYSAIGAPCDGTDQRCLPGAFCTDGICVAQQASGPCQDTPEQCTVQSYCGANQQCQPKLANGAECMSGDECTSNSCTSDGRASGVCDSGNTLMSQACAGAL